MLDGAEEAALDGNAMTHFFKNKLVDEFLDPSGEVRLRAMAAAVGGVESDLRCRLSVKEMAAAGIPAGTELTYNHAQRACNLPLYDYKDATTSCAAINMTLPIVHSDTENDKLKDFLKREGVDKIWLGASDAAEEGSWVWQDEKKMNFSNWGSGEPNNGRGAGEDCLLTTYGSWKANLPSGGGWNDERCGGKQTLICQSSANNYHRPKVPPAKQLTNFHNRTHGDIALWLDFNLGRAVDSSRNRLEVVPLGEELFEPTHVQGRVALCPPPGGLRLPGRPLALNMGCDGLGAVDLGEQRRWCEPQAAFTWETQLMPNPLNTSSTAESVIFGQVRDPFDADATVLTLRHNDSALLFFGIRVENTILSARTWSHVAVTRAPDPGNSNQTLVQVWINGTWRAEKKADAGTKFELRKLGSGDGDTSGVCLDDIIITRDNDGGDRPCGSAVCLNDMTEATSIQFSRDRTDIPNIGKTQTVADQIAHLMSPTIMVYDPNDSSMTPNQIKLEGRVGIESTSATSAEGRVAKKKGFTAVIWFGNSLPEKGVEGPLRVGGGTKVVDGEIGYTVLISLFLVGIIILANAIFDVCSTRKFLSKFDLKSRQEDGTKSLRQGLRERAPTGSVIWHMRTEEEVERKKVIPVHEALRHHFFDSACNPSSNWLNIWVGVLFVSWSIFIMTNNNQGSYIINLIISGISFVSVAFWALLYFRFHPGLRIFTSTVYNAGPDLVDTITVMGFLMTCFAFATHSWMGLLGSMDAYADVTHTFFMLMEMAFTGISFDDFATEGRGKAFIGLGFTPQSMFMKYTIFWLMVIIFTVVMANLLIAVISDAYEEARGDRDETQLRLSAIHIVLRKIKSVVMTPRYLYRHMSCWGSKAHDTKPTGVMALITLSCWETDSIGYLRWQRDWFALTPGGLRLVAACTNPFTVTFMSNAEIFSEVNAEAKERAGDTSVAESLLEMNAGEEAKSPGEGSAPPVAASGILEKEQLETIFDKHGQNTLKSYCCSNVLDAQRLLALFGKSWTEADVVQRGNVIMEKWRRALPDGWRGTSATERGCARAVERSPKIIQMDKSIKSIPKMEKDMQIMKESIQNLESNMNEMKVMLRALLGQQQGHP